MNPKQDFIIRGNIIDATSERELRSMEDGYLVCVDGKSAGVYSQIPEQYAHLPVEDYSGKLIVPGLVDLHLHAPQYTFRGMGMDLELLAWLEANTFPEEMRYHDLEYAARAYKIFVEDLKNSATTRACVFATIHTPATLLLMKLLEESGLRTMVGKVNMDRNSPDGYCEGTSASLDETRAWLRECQFAHCKPILTPRFTPSCSDALMQGLGELQKETGLPVQSHLSENLSEIEWVKGLCPNTKHYGESYSRYGLFGGACPTIMAHCVYSDGEELALMKDNGVFLAHCPQSNTNLTSGVAPVRRWLAQGINAGLGSDIAGGASLSIFRAMSDAVQASKLRKRLLDDQDAQLTLADAFYLATRGGGAFFGKVGCFEEGYELDALILDDASIPAPREFALVERLERLVYLSDDRQLAAKYVSGEMIFGR